MRSRSRTAALLGAAAALAAGFVVAGSPAAYAGDRSDYIVVLKGSTSDPAAVADAQAGRYGTKAGHVYRHALKGYSVSLSESAAQALRADPSVAFVARDGVAHIQAQTVPTGVRRIFADDNPNLDIDGVDDVRIDADVAVLDTGTAAVADLNVVARTNCANLSSCVDGQGNDGHGHGTHVSGTVGAIDNDLNVVGVAPGVRLWSVKVLADNGSGSFAGIIAGIDWVAARSADIEVINMSLGCTGAQCANPALNTAITGAVDRGVVVVVAAGNDGLDASGTVPANHPDVVTVSALSDSDGEAGGTGGSPSCRADEDDTLANFSNFGRLVEVAAPGVCILSTSNTGGTTTFSGTSMATPHVAGAAAILASGANKPTDRAGVFAIRQKLIDTGNLNWTDERNDGHKEPLLDVHDPGQFPPPGGGNRPPVARFVETCDNATLTCRFDGSGSSDPDGTIAGFAWDFGDGTTGTGAQVSHTYARAGTFTVRLTVTDNQGATGSTSKTITVGAPTNQPPVARFTNTCFGFLHLCIFNGTASSDPDGTIASWRWNFGDGTTGTGSQVFHIYPRTGAFTVTLTVTDNLGATGTLTRTINVP